MRNRIVPLIFFAILVLSSCSDDPLMHGDDAPVGSVGSVAGSYVLNGIDPYGKEYTGRLDITDGPGANSYDFHWIVTEAFQEGTGTLRGNVFEIVWKTSAEAALAVQGTAEFTMTVDGELYGSKRVDGGEDEWLETAYPIGPDDV